MRASFPPNFKLEFKVQMTGKGGSSSQPHNKTASEKKKGLSDGVLVETSEIEREYGEM